MPLSISNQHQRQKPQVDKPFKQINNFMEKRGTYDKENGSNPIQQTASNFKKHSMNHVYQHSMQQEMVANNYGYQNKFKDRNIPYS